ncbi:MAG TPA: precorrin-6y C5,15-methyltransferase (decarboxylating) subunit CbiE [Candidatus Sulfotelmatobacter sp.]|jgi:precorrin-6Y C5,15-methyltransferase (decarboxylating)|nr:precorrin-6y C5,15-methyltransferase (decarboxylating) subunit CbiE [Candidatus Sulfotelmatobacter sp.]
MSQHWLSIIGIGEDGLNGLSPAARTLIDQAEVLAGGERHLAMVPGTQAEQLVWTSPFAANLERLEAMRGRKVCVLASGDPQWFGVGVTIARHIPTAEITVLAQPGAFSLAAARLGWGLQDCACLTIHGRPLDGLSLHLHPGARLLVLSENAASPAKLAALLTAKGWGRARITVLERLGGPLERIFSGTAEDWNVPAGEDLNTVAVELAQGPVLSRLAGLPDGAFIHDGQLTKREVRAVTLATLAPWPGALLWDVGAGCGSIAVEWARAGGRSVAIEQIPARLDMIARNAAELGVPHALEIVAGKAPDALDGLDIPNAVFIGGGATVPGLLERCWDALAPGGRLAANAVTLEGEARLIAWQAANGGELSRVAVSRLGKTGRFQSWHPLMPVTHYCGIKP